MQNDIDITTNNCDLDIVCGSVVPDEFQAHKLARELALASYKYIAVDVRDIKTSYIRLGFHLFECRNNKYYTDFGFDNLADFVAANFGLDKSALSRCLKVYDRFSLCQSGSHKMVIDDRYKDYSYSQLCEMVSMDDGQLEGVKPSMTVKEIRSLKKKPDSPVPELEKVATSQQAEEKHDERWFVKRYMEISPEEAEKIAEICRREKSNSDRAKAVQKELSPYGSYFYSTSDFSFSFGNFVKGCEFCIGTEKMNLKYGRLVVELMALMEEGVILPELPKLKNDTQRKEWLENYKSWGLWYRDENIDVNYYKFDFSDGSCLIVSEYPQRENYWYDEEEDEHYFHLLQKGKRKSGISVGRKYDEKYRHTVDSTGDLVKFLKDLQK